MDEFYYTFVASGFIMLMEVMSDMDQFKAAALEDLRETVYGSINVVVSSASVRWWPVRAAVSFFKFNV